MGKVPVLCPALGCSLLVSCLLGRCGGHAPAPELPPCLQEVRQAVHCQGQRANGLQVPAWPILPAALWTAR